MRLCIATPLYPPEPGGPATYARALEIGLAKQQATEVTIVKFSDVRRYPKVIRHGMYIWLLFKATKDAHVILALDPVSTGLPAYIVSRIRGIPLVVKIVGDYAWEQARQRFGVRASIEEFIQSKDTHMFVHFLRCVQTFVVKRARRIIVPSRYLGGIIRSWGVSLAHVSVVYNCVPVTHIGAVPKELKKRETLRIVTVGRLVPWKNIGGIIDALVHVGNPQATLVVVGDGPDKKSLEKYATSRLKDRVTFAGALSHSDTQAVIASADVFVLNSTYEGLSHLLIEALSLGTPIIATSAGGNAEVVEHNVTGTLIPVNDSKALTRALDQLFSDPSAFKRMAVRGKKSAERFVPENMLEGTYAVLASSIEDTIT